MSNRITHVRKPEAHSTLEHIEALKGTDPDGKEWEATVSDIIFAIKHGREFYVEVGRYKFAAVIATSRAGHEYIRTRPDLTMLDNLLSLPPF
jgi:hypothetical protein